MSKKPLPNLPDLEDDDADFQRKIQPLVERALPNERKSDLPDNRKTVSPDNRKYIHTNNRNSGLIEAARAVELVEATRGAKKRFEYLIPERVGRALAQDAAKRGISATTRLLEVLRDSGYPVIPEDLIDLRKLPKR
jgi:hypothetical protein